MWAAVCGQTLSCNNTMPLDSCSRRLLRISGFSLPIICRRFAISSTVSRLSNRTMSRTRSVLSVVAVDGRPTPSSWVTLVRPFLEFFYPFVDTPLRQNSVPVLCWKSSVDFGPWYTFRPTKNGSLNAALPWCKWKVERPWLTLRLGQRNWPSNFKHAQLW